jgi:hypothetical protein
MNIDAWHALLIWLLVTVVRIVFWGFVPQTLLAPQLLPVALQFLAIAGIVVASWHALTLRSVKLDNRIGLAFLVDLAATASTSGLWWLWWRAT